MAGCNSDTVSLLEHRFALIILYLFKQKMTHTGTTNDLLRDERNGYQHPLL